MTQDSVMRMYPLAAFFRDSFVKHALATARLTQAIKPSVSQLLSRHLGLILLPLHHPMGLDCYILGVGALLHGTSSNEHASCEDNTKTQTSAWARNT